MRKSLSLLASAVVVGFLIGVTACGGDEPANRPGSISGTVTLKDVDDASGVLVKAGGVETTTPSDGSYTVAGVGPGEVTLSASKDGYEPFNKTVEVSSGETSSVDITMKKANLAPEIQNASLDPETIEPGEKATLSVEATDPNDDKLSYKWEAPKEWKLASPESKSTEITAPDKFGQKIDVKVTVSDPKGESDATTLTLRTGENNAPVIQSAQASPPQPKPGQKVNVTVSATDPDGDELSYEWSGPSGWSIASPKKATTAVTAPNAYGESASLNVEVSDGNGASTSTTVVVSTPSNNGPRITSLSASPKTVAKGGKIVATVGADDPNGDDLSYSWSASSNWMISKNSMKPSQAEVTAPSAPGATGVIEVTVSDGNGGTSTASTTVSTAVNNAPIIKTMAADKSPIQLQGSTQITVTANDPDGDSLSYMWSASGSGWSVSGSGASATVTAPNSYGSRGTITVKASDGFGGATTDSMTIETIQNSAPNILKLSVNPTTVKRGSTASAEVVANDPNGDSLSYSWSMSKSGWSVTKDPNDGSKATITPPNQPSDQAVVTVTVSDGNGGSAQSAEAISTPANNPPRITKPVTDMKAGDPGNPSPISYDRIFSYQIEASDPDGDSLSYSLTTKPSGAKIDSKGMVTWKPSKADQGFHNFVIRVSDGFDSVDRKVEIEVGTFQFDSSAPLNLTKDDGMAFGDLDGDGFTDVVYVNRRSSRSADLEVAYGSNQGFRHSKTFHPAKYRSRAVFCASPAIGDVDGDGHPDIAVLCDEGRSADADDLSYYIYKNNGKRGFTSGEAHYFNLNDSFAAADIELGDVDGDGDADMVACGRENLVLARNDGSGSFRSYDRWYDNYHRWRQVEIADMDGDNKGEIVTTYEDWRGVDYAYVAVRDVQSNGQIGSWLGRQRYPNRYDDDPDVLGVNDLNGDGSPDVVMGEDRSNTLVIYKNSGTGSMTQTDKSFYTSPPHFWGHNAIAFADIDGDGNQDIVVGADGRGDVQIFFGDGSAKIDSRELIAPPSGYSGGVFGVHTTQWDNDSDPDIVIGTERGHVGVLY